MKQFKDFVAIGQNSELLKLIHLATDKPPRNWTRDLGREKQLRSISTDDDDRTFVFMRKAGSPRPSGALFVMLRSDRLEITNVVPLTYGSLTHDQYNSIVDEFAAHCRKLVLAAGLDITVSLSEDVVAMSALMSDNAWTLLQRFASLANPSSGSAHPMDFERWVAFIIRAHNDQAALDSETLARWLVEDRDWADDVAYSLGSEYSFGRRLLAAYSGQE